MTRLHVINFGLALGITWGLGMLLLGLLAWQTGIGSPMVMMMATLYLGFTPTLIGSAIGAIWAFVDMFIAGVVIAWIYNALTKASEE